MRVWNILLIIILLASVFLITSCGSNEGIKCDLHSECPGSGECFIGKCRDGFCAKEKKDDCCGNFVCEPGAGESRCDCKIDCGKCDGKVKYNVTTRRGLKEEEANYAQYFCIEEECIIGVKEEDVNVLKLTDNIDERGAFKGDVLTTINNPFDTAKDKINIEISLTDIETDIIGGITFTRIQVLSGSELMGRKLNLNKNLKQVGELFVEEFELTSAQNNVEQEKSIDIEISYEYVELDRDVEELERSSEKNRLSNRIIFIAP